MGVLCAAVLGMHFFSSVVVVGSGVLVDGVF